MISLSRTDSFRGEGRGVREGRLLNPPGPTAGYVSLENHLAGSCGPVQDAGPHIDFPSLSRTQVRQEGVVCVAGDGMGGPRTRTGQPASHQPCPDHPNETKD